MGVWVRKSVVLSFIRGNMPQDFRMEFLGDDRDRENDGPMQALFWMPMTYTAGMSFYQNSIVLCRCQGLLGEAEAQDKRVSGETRGWSRKVQWKIACVVSLMCSRREQE